MGLYDRVIYPGCCDGCGKTITEYQTKDTKNPAVLGVSLRRQRNLVNVFFTTCYCGTQITYERIGSTFKKISTYPKNFRKHHGHAPPSYPDGKGPEEK